MCTFGCGYISTRWVPEVNSQRFSRIITPRGVLFVYPFAKHGPSTGVRIPPSTPVLIT